MRATTSRSSRLPDWLRTVSHLPKLFRQVKIPHEADDMFELISDIRRYPEFIKWIRSMKVTDKQQDGRVRRYRGEADVGFKGFSEVFATDVRADAQDRKIEVELAHGPFKKLRNSWSLKPDTQGNTLIDFFIDYEFRNPVLALLARANTELAVNRIMKAFRDEADRRYGKGVS